MDAAAVVTSVHTKEITRQFYSQQGDMSLPHFSPENGDLAEKPDFWVESEGDEEQAELFGERSYRAERLQEFPDLAVLTEQVYREHDENFATCYRDRFWKCRTMAWYVRDVETNMIRIQSNSCRLRWCPMCADARAKIILHSCREFFEKKSSVRFLTLTQKHNDLPLKEQIAQIKKSFVALRRCSGWRKYVTGCVWFLQIKPNCGGKWWHVHLHILLTGSYIPQKWLSEKWLKITGDSKIVDIRSVENVGKALKDVARYVGRPANLLDVASEYRLELVNSTDRIRVCGTTGLCRALSLRPPKFNGDDSSNENLGRYSTIQKLAANGDESARDIIRANRNGVPLKNATSFRDVDDFIDDEFVGLSELERGRAPPGMGVVVEPDNYWDW